MNTRALLIILICVSIFATSIFGDWPVYKGNSSFTGSDTIMTINPLTFGKISSVNLGGGRITAGPVIYKEFTYLGTWDGRFVKYDNSNSRIEWMAEGLGRLKSTAACGGGLIVVGSMNDTIYVFRPESNIPYVKIATKGSVMAPVNYVPEKGRFYVGSFDRKVYCIDTTGNLCWTWDPNGSQGNLFEGNASNNHIIEHGIPYHDGKFYVVTSTVVWIFADNGGSAEYLGRYFHTADGGEYHQPLTMTPVLSSYGDSVYLFSGTTWKERNTYASCFNITGSTSLTLPLGSNTKDHFVNTPACDLSGVYLLSNNFGLFFKLTPDGKKLIGKNLNSEFRSTSGIVLTREHFIYQTDNGQLCVREKAESSGFKHIVNSPFTVTDTASLAYGFRGIRSPAAVDGDRIYFGADDGNLYCYGNNAAVSINDNICTGVAIGIIDVYPNPFNPVVRIKIAADKIDNIKSNAIIRVVNAQGKLVASIPLDWQKGEMIWNAGSMPAGLYIMELSTKESRHVKKVILSR